MSQPTAEISFGSKARGYLELVRLPNVFTAAADVTMGYLVVHHRIEPPTTFALIVGASALLYMAGIVLNDVYDAALDAQERPYRPIPSGRVPLHTAGILGWTLLILGVAAAWTATYSSGTITPGVIATLLAGAVWLYDGVVKGTILGPPVMGGCRVLNVLLGMSATAEPWDAAHWIIAGGIGVYVAGVTWFARTEAGDSRRLQLALATAVILSGIGLLAWFPAWSGDFGPPISLAPRGRSFLWTMLAVLIGWRCLRAVFQPTAPNVQAAVKNCILSMIVLDAAVVLVAFGSHGPGIPWAMVVFALLLPAMFLGKWIYST